MGAPNLDLAYLHCHSPRLFLLETPNLRPCHNQFITMMI